nr:MAG TPA: hypothetical protein [Caudoviricetes sp.]
MIFLNLDNIIYLPRYAIYLRLSILKTENRPVLPTPNGFHRYYSGGCLI